MFGKRPNGNGESRGMAGETRPTDWGNWFSWYCSRAGAHAFAADWHRHQYWNYKRVWRVSNAINLFLFRQLHTTWATRGARGIFNENAVQRRSNDNLIFFVLLVTKVPPNAGSGLVEMESSRKRKRVNGDGWCCYWNQTRNEWWRRIGKAKKN